MGEKEGPGLASISTLDLMASSQSMYSFRRVLGPAFPLRGRSVIEIFREMHVYACGWVRACVSSLCPKGFASHCRPDDRAAHFLTDLHLRVLETIDSDSARLEFLHDAVVAKLGEPAEASRRKGRGVTHAILLTEVREKKETGV